MFTTSAEVTEAAAGPDASAAGALPSPSPVAGREPTLEEELVYCARRLDAAMKRHGVKGFRRACEVSGRRFTFGCRNHGRKKADRESLDGLPPNVKPLTKNFRRVYLTLRDARRSSEWAGRKIGGKELLALVNRGPHKDSLSERTLFRALKALGELHEVYVDSSGGYQIGTRQPSLDLTSNSEQPP